LESDGTIIWKGIAENLGDAKLSVKALAQSSPGDYLIFSPLTGDKTIVKLEECA
jgi:hypothetical protein